jgi:lipid-A-disaccharide synthase
VITIDAPDFNLGLARQLHQHGMTTIHYVSPSVWAWRPGRIPKIARSLDQLLTLFPFEPALYQPFGLDARFVGHPLADELSAGPDQANARENLQIRSETPVIALLPGSRDSELRRHMGLLADTAAVLRGKYPDGELMLLLTGERHRALAVDLAGPRLNQAGVRLRTGLTRTGLEAADVAVAASGTVTLEAFLLECPMVVFYKLAPTTFLLARSLKLVRSEFVALPNILSGQLLVPERLQHAAAPERLAADVMSWLSDQARLEDYCQRARQWRSQLARQAGHQAASAIVECMHGRLG